MRIFDSDLAGSLTVMRLPAIPGVLARLVEQCQGAEAGQVACAQTIALDPGMTSKVLSAASASQDGGLADLTDIEQAVTLLGPQMMRTLLMKEAVMQSLSDAPADRADLRSFWKHSLTTALIARTLAGKIGYPRIEEAYLAGLLHDIGRLTMLAAFPREYGSLFHRPHASVGVMEQKLLHLSHAQAGAALAEAWKLDSYLSDSILYHHEPPVRLASAHLLIRIVSVAHTLATEGARSAACRECAPLLGLTAAELEPIHAGAEAEVIRIAHDLKIDLFRPAEASQADGAGPAPAADHSGRSALSDNISDMLLASEARHSFNSCESQSELLDSAMQTARVLFASRSAMVMQRDANGNVFTVTAAAHDSRAVREFSLPLAGGGAIVDNAVQLRLSFIDRSSTLLGMPELQVLRILCAESLVSIPFSDGKQCVAVLLLGLAAESRQALHERQGLLGAFATQVNDALQALAGGAETPDRRIAEVTEEFQSRAQRAAHEVNNPLAIIQNYFTVLERKLVKHELGGSEIPLLREELDRIVHIVHGLCEFQPATTQNSQTDLRSVIGNIVQLFAQTEFLPSSIRLTSSIPEGTVDIDSDIDALKQILINLIKNAVEALPQGGDIKVGVHERLANRDGKLFAVLSVKDTGTGIPDDVMARLFSPVKSSKGSGYRGLGLSIVNNLVESIGGYITCHSATTGTNFEILLPVSVHASRVTIPPKYATRTAASL